MPRPVAIEGALRTVCRTEFRRLYRLLGDGELLSRFLRERDEIAFEELVLRHGPMVRAVCRRILGATADADDAFQATFLVLIRKARSIRRTELLANWLCAVAYRTAKQALRRRWRMGAREQNVATLPEPSRLDDPPRDWLPLFDAALQRLPRRYREVIVLCDLQELSRSEAARKLQVNEGTLSSRLGRARDMLRKRLDKHGFPLAVGSALAPAVVPESLTASTVAAVCHSSAASVSAIILTEGVVTAMFASKLKAIAGCAAVVVAGLVVGLQFTGPRPAAGGPPAKESALKPPAKAETKAETASKIEPSATLPDGYELFQGEWVATAAEQDGVATTIANVDVEERWKFTGNMLRTGGEAKEDAAEKFTIDVRIKPMPIDFKLTQFTQDKTGRLSKTGYQGICKFEPDGRLVICYRTKDDGVLRPTRFATARNSGATLLTLRRAVPPRPIAMDAGVPTLGGVDPFASSLRPPKEILPSKLDEPDIALDVRLPASRSDIDLLQGVWRLTRHNGDPVRATSPGEGVGESTIEILKDRVLHGTGHGRLSLDTAKVPKQMTIEISGDGRIELNRLIYKIEGDTLTLAGTDKSEKLVPIDFEPAPGSGITVDVYERVKDIPPPPPPISPPMTASPPTRSTTPRPIPSPSRPNVPSIPPSIPSARDPLSEPDPKPAERDLLKEIDQLREQLKRLEKELKDRRSEPALPGR